MIQNTLQAKAGGLPRLAVINSFAGFGRCSTTISLPVISVMKVQVCPVPTSVLSNHLAFPHVFFDDYTDHMRDILHTWEKLDLSFDGLYCGFLGSVDQIEIVQEFLNSSILRKNKAKPFFLLDPVMGDNGKTYSSITQEHCNALKKLAACADLLTPNITELCRLTDTPYREGPWTCEDLRTLCELLASRSSKSMRIVVTGLQENDHILNYIWEEGNLTVCKNKIAGTSRHGTGDLFASILAADAMHEVPLAVSVQKAADFISLCIKGSDEAGTPLKEGILFEKYLSCLLS